MIVNFHHGFQLFKLNVWQLKSRFFMFVSEELVSYENQEILIFSYACWIQFRSSIEFFIFMNFGPFFSKRNPHKSIP